MKKNNLKKVLKKIYKILDYKQKIKFLIIVLIMIVSAILTQMTPKAIGQLTDDVLNVNGVTFEKVVPFLIIILVLLYMLFYK